MNSYLLVLGLVAGALAAPADDVAPKKISPRASFEISTPDLKGIIVDPIKGIVDKNTEIAKDTVGLVTGSVKDGLGVGQLAIEKGMGVATAGVDAFTDIGSAGIKMGTGIADKAFGIVDKVGGMIPGAGLIISGGAKLGQQGAKQVNDVGTSVLDRIKGALGSGFGWVTDTSKKGNEMIGSAVDTVEGTINSGLDKKADMVNQMVSTGVGLIPQVTVGGKFEVNGK